jgi:hypothetical protein
MLPLVTLLPHVHQLTLPSAPASCCILFSSTPASCVVFHQPVTLRPPPFITSPRVSHPAGCYIASLSSGWLLHPLSSCWHLPSAGISASHCAVASHHAPFRAIASCTSDPAGCCIASPHATISDLPASLPIIAPSPLVVPLPPIPLVWMVVTLPFLMPPPPIRQLCLSLHRRLLSCPSPCH